MKLIPIFMLMVVDDVKSEAVAVTDWALVIVIITSDIRTGKWLLYPQLLKTWMIESELQGAYV